MKIAFVYDRVNKFGGAERVLLALHEIWPQAPLYTAIYNKEKAPWAKEFKVIPSFLNRLPFTSTNHEMLPLFTPAAFESFDFSKFDVILTVTSSDAKGIITNPHTLHICYLLTPTRYIWNSYQDHLENPGFDNLNPLVRIFMKLLSPTLRRWDYIAANRPDYYIAISKTVAQRIKSYYRRDADIIYPPVDTDKFTISRSSPGRSSLQDKPFGHLPGVAQRLLEGELKNDYFLIVSRLVPYKKIDYAILAFNELGWNLKIIGNGIDENRLKKIAKNNIEFISSGLTDKKLCWYYQNCKGFVFPGEEDFGISAVEAQACGKPLIGINEGGIREIIIPQVTGEIYDDYTKDTLIMALKKFIQKKYLSSDCRMNATRFSKQNFQKMMKNTLQSYWEKWKREKPI